MRLDNWIVVVVTVSSGDGHGCLIRTSSVGGAWLLAVVGVLGVGANGRHLGRGSELYRVVEGADESLVGRGEGSRGA